MVFQSYALYPHPEACPQPFGWGWRSARAPMRPPIARDLDAVLEGCCRLV